MKKILSIAFRLFFVCLICVAALAGVNAVTADKIAENEREEIQRALSQIIPDATYMPMTAQNAGEEFSRIDEAYIAYKGGEYAGCAVIIRAKGYGGDIALRVGFDANGGIAGIIVGSHSETPNLGAKITEEEFRGQFNGLKEQAVLRENITPISGATISSAGVTEAVNTARAYMDAYLEIFLKEGPAYGEA